MATWRLTDHEANLAIGQLAARLDLARPERGLTDWTLDGRPLAGGVFEVDLGDPSRARADAPIAVDDAYVRGDDLVAVYGPSPTSPYRMQIYWRGAAATSRAAALGAVDLVASVQTPLLDSRPELRVACTLPGGDSPQGSLWRLSSRAGESLAAIDVSTSGASSDASGDLPCFLWRPAGADWSLAAMVHPADWQGASATLVDSGAVRLEFALFARFLEKGVILRSRLRSVFLAREGDAASAAAWFGDLTTSKLPLTT
jgi:hypothetical protein